MDYHLAEVVRETRLVPSGERVTYCRAVCDCGWAGALRESYAGADDDTYAHDNTENER